MSGQRRSDYRSVSTVANDRQLWPLASNVRILLTDDDPVFVSLAEAALQSIATTLVVAHDGAQALDQLQKQSCDIAIIDLSMPKVDGFRLIAWIRDMPQTRELPIMVVTTRDDWQALDEAYRLGANLLLTKPLNWNAFPYQVSAVLRGLAPATREPAFASSAIGPVRSNGRAMTSEQSVFGSCLP